MANQTDDVVSRVKPAPRLPDGTANPRARKDAYGASAIVSYTHKPEQMLADEGSYFVATNPTPGTGIASLAAPTTYDDTKPFITVQYTTTSGRRLFLDFLKLQCTAAGTGGTALNAVIVVDNAASRWTSGGSAITPVNPNMDDSTKSEAVINVGALVAAAAANKRIVWVDTLRPVIPVVGDTYLIEFGGNPAMNSLAVAGTAIANVAKKAPPVILGNGQNAAINLWLPSQSAASSYEFVLGFHER